VKRAVASRNRHTNDYRWVNKRNKIVMQKRNGKKPAAAAADASKYYQLLAL
jgi:hypothetical protein